MAIANSRHWPSRLPARLKFQINPRTSMHTRTVVLHTFSIGDVEDPMLCASIPIHKWQQSEKGQWCMENCEGDVYFCSSADPITFGYKIALQGKMSEPNYTFFKLKWGDVSSHS